MGKVATILRIFGVTRRTGGTITTTFASAVYVTVITFTLAPNEELGVKGFGGFVSTTTDGLQAIVAHRLRLRFSLDTTLDLIVGSPAGVSTEFFFPGRKLFRNTTTLSQTVTVAAAHNDSTSQLAYCWLEEG